MSRKEKRGAVAEIGQSGYYARITKQRGGHLVEFPDLPGCLTEGKTIREALHHGREALSGWLFVAIRKGDEIPPGRVRRGLATTSSSRTSTSRFRLRSSPPASAAASLRHRSLTRSG
jgi:predicted RNase H-like HicB family nuclease